VSRRVKVIDVMEFLRSNANLSANLDIQASLQDMDALVSYLKIFNIMDKVSFNLSLARGLDYYTGVIFEAIMMPILKTVETAKAAKMAETAKTAETRAETEDSAFVVGSIAAGGRYNNLVGMYSKRQIPCVGISFGVDLIFAIINTYLETQTSILTPDIDV